MRELPIQYPANFNSSRAERKASKNSPIEGYFVCLKKFTWTRVVPLQEKDAESVRKAFAKEIRTLPKELAKTLTYDQGKEMSGHKRFTLSTGMQVYFAHPASPWERGTNENTNGLIRQYFPKGTDFRTTSVRELKQVQRSLNGRPRKVLKFATPQEVFNQCVALDSRS